MPPIMVFEVLWKVLWFAIVALPHVIANDIDASFETFLFSMLCVIPIIAVTPGDRMEALRHQRRGALDGRP